MLLIVLMVEHHMVMAIRMKLFSGNYNNYVELNNTIKGFEEFTFLNGTIKIKLDNAVFNSVENYNVVFDASAQLQTDALYLIINVTTGIMTVYGGGWE